MSRCVFRRKRDVCPASAVVVRLYLMCCHVTTFCVLAQVPTILSDCPHVRYVVVWLNDAELAGLHRPAQHDDDDSSQARCCSRAG